MADVRDRTIFLGELWHGYDLLGLVDGPCLQCKEEYQGTLFWVLWVHVRAYVLVRT